MQNTHLKRQKLYTYSINPCLDASTCPYWSSKRCAFLDYPIKWHEHTSTFYWQNRHINSSKVAPAIYCSFVVTLQTHCANCTSGHMLHTNKLGSLSSLHHSVSHCLTPACIVILVLRHHLFPGHGQWPLVMRTSPVVQHGMRPGIERDSSVVVHRQQWWLYLETRPTCQHRWQQDRKCQQCTAVGKC